MQPTVDRSLITTGFLAASFPRLAKNICFQYYLVHDPSRNMSFHGTALFSRRTDRSTVAELFSSGKIFDSHFPDLVLTFVLTAVSRRSSLLLQRTVSSGDINTFASET